ncbi:hypothetical protein [Desulfofalx alkaliphila]|uniref:hypothetical protein n=1 Tax=Desulfofalx alkaliphila TaxID=105483 RepID=UPI0004E27787|nr:hypothetical protein [Desulfofalx alkaliphila]
MIKCTIYPEKVADLSKEEMEALIVSVLHHVNRSITYNTGPIELSNRILTELVEKDLLDVIGGGCGGCTSCAPPMKYGKPKEGKVIKFPTKE